MLAYYSSLVKREELLSCLLQDGRNLASLSNDLVCKIKEFNAACEQRDIEGALNHIAEADNMNKVVSAILTNLKGNYESYVQSLVPEKKEEQKQEEKVKTTNAEPEQLKTLLETVRSLKEMKDSLGQ